MTQNNTADGGRIEIELHNETQTAFRCPDCNNAYEPTIYAGDNCPICLAELPPLPSCDRCDADIDPRDGSETCPECGWRQ